ncbi:hypothetical protein ACFPM0_12090 [Pseudonocardia sulfidoxydans]
MNVASVSREGAFIGRPRCRTPRNRSAATSATCGPGGAPGRSSTPPSG